MDPPPRTLNETLAAVERVPIPHPAAALLRSYIVEALQPQAAADYVQRRLREDGHVDSLVADWIYVVQSVISGVPPPAPTTDEIKCIAKRDGNRCCASGRRGSFFDPLVVVPILPVPSGWLKGEKRIIELLIAFFGRQYFDWWYQFIDKINLASPYHSHWLVRKSVHEALQRGTIKLVRIPTSMIEFRVELVSISGEDLVEIDGQFALLGDHSRQGVETADARLIGSHARFCKSIQLVNLARRIAPSLSPEFSEIQNVAPTPRQNLSARVLSGSSHVGHIMPRLVMPLWLLLPAAIRVAAYKLLSRVGFLLFGKPDFQASVQRLPLDLYLKHQHSPITIRNEYNALKLLERHTTVPAPRALDIVIQKTGDNADESGHLLTTRIPGTTLADCHDMLSDQDCETISTQLANCISQMRDIPMAANSGAAICNTLGEACSDPRIKDWAAIGPFPDEASFSQHLRFSDEPSRRGHKIVFTHADLNPRNILVERTASHAGQEGWQLSGIVDWETAGFYPEYWDYTKSMFEGFRWPRRHNEMMRRVFSEFGNYDEELAVETRAWESGDGV